MHNSDDSELETAGVRLYMDESGTDGPGTPHAIVGGMIVNRSHFQPFEDAWDVMLDAHGVVPPLHMKEFTPHGKCSGMSPCCRHELFQEAAELINKHKILSMAASIKNEDFRCIIQPEVRDRFGVYAMGFLLAVVLNHKLAENSKYQHRIQFILDTGNPYADHARKAHSTALELQRSGEMYLHAGSLTFADDADVGALQAADIIAWSVRRQLSGKPFGYMFSPLESVISPDNNHEQKTWEPDFLVELARAMAPRIKAMEDARARNENEE